MNKDFIYKRAQESLESLRAPLISSLDDVVVLLYRLIGRAPKVGMTRLIYRRDKQKKSR